MPTESRADVVVIGAGMGGLSAAVALAARGLQVHVVEAGPRPGGKVDIHRHDDVEMDTGPSVLTLPDVVDRVLRRAGTSLASELELISPAPAFRYRYPDGTCFDVYPELEATLDSAAAAFGVKARRQLESFLAYARQIWETSRDAFVLGPPPRVSALTRQFVTRPGDVMRVDPFRTMAEAIIDRLHHPKLHDVMLRYATYNGSSPFLAPATLNCIAHVEIGLGMYGVKGGMHELARALRRVGEARGVQFQWETTVRSILKKGGRVRGVELADDTCIDAPHVVVNADVAHLVSALLPTEKRHLPKPGRPSMSGVCLLVKARRRPTRVGHEVLFPETYADEFHDIFDRRVAPQDPTLYLCAQEKAHSRTGWAEHEPVFVMANAPPVESSGDGRGTTASDRDAARLIDTVSQKLVRAGLIDVDDEVIWQRTPADLGRRFPGSAGAIYGAASHGWAAAFQRPKNRVEGVPGLYLASGTAHPGGGVPLCLMSGLTAADLLWQDVS